MHDKEIEIDEKWFQPASNRQPVVTEATVKTNQWHRKNWFRFRKSTGGMIGFLLIAIIVIMTVVGPSLNEYSYREQDLSRSNLPAKLPGLEHVSWLPFDGVDVRGVDQYERKGVDGYFWFGTDAYGRDQWTRVWQGTRISLWIAFAAALIDLVIGALYGGISGYYGGKTDMMMQRLLEILVGIPNLVLIIIMILILKPGFVSIIIALAITGWTGMARIVRGQVLKLKEEYISAAKVLGASSRRILVKHLLPNTLGIMIVTTMFTIPSAIFFEAFLSFIGLGIAPPEASLGSLINEGFKRLNTYPHLTVFPAVVISLIMISFNLLGDGLRDLFDPKVHK